MRDDWSMPDVLEALGYDPSQLHELKRAEEYIIFTAERASGPLRAEAGRDLAMLMVALTADVFLSPELTSTPGFGPIRWYVKTSDFEALGSIGMQIPPVVSYIRYIDVTRLELRSRQGRTNMSFSRLAPKNWPRAARAMSETWVAGPRGAHV